MGRPSVPRQPEPAGAQNYPEGTSEGKPELRDVQQRDSWAAKGRKGEDEKADEEKDEETKTDRSPEHTGSEKGELTPRETMIRSSAEMERDRE